MTQSLENSRKRLISIDEYHRMAEAQILGPNDRVELIHGEILNKSPIGNKHIAVVNRITNLFVATFIGNAIVQIQGPIQIGNFSEPEPDILLCQPKDDFYLDQKPNPSDTFLLIEVSDTTINYDKTVKLPLYAESGIPEYWIIDVNDDQIFKYSLPEGKQYKKMEIVSITDSICCNHFPDKILKVKNIIG